MKTTKYISKFNKLPIHNNGISLLEHIGPIRWETVNQSFDNKRERK